MERRKASTSSIDELAIVKAAAWAWYQRGSSSEARPILEYDLTRTTRSPKPSRYKLQALKEAQEQEETMGLDQESSLCCSTPSPTHTDFSSLFDTYEIERISKDLDYYIEASHAGYFGGGHRRIISLLEDGKSGVNSVKSKNKSKKIKGFWFKNPVMCGSSDEVVNSTVFRGGSGRR